MAHPPLIPPLVPVYAPVDRDVVRDRLHGLNRLHQVTVIGLPQAAQPLDAFGRSYLALLRDNRTREVTLVTYAGPKTNPVAISEHELDLGALGVFWSESITLALMNHTEYDERLSPEESVQRYATVLHAWCVPVQHMVALHQPHVRRSDGHLVIGYLVIDNHALAIVVEGMDTSDAVLAAHPVETGFDINDMRAGRVLQPIRSA